MCLARTNGFLCYGKDDYKGSNCQNIAARISEAYYDPPNAPDDLAPKRNHFYCLQSKANMDKDTDMLCFCFLSCDGFPLCGGVW